MYYTYYLGKVVKVAPGPLHTARLLTQPTTPRGPPGPPLVGPVRSVLASPRRASASGSIQVERLRPVNAPDEDLPDVDRCADEQAEYSVASRRVA